MGLRTRLALFFVAITVVPLLVAVLVLQWQLGARLTGLAERELAGARTAAELAVATVRARAGDLATALSRDAGPILAAGAARRADARLARIAGEAVPERAAIVGLGPAAGRVLAARRSPPAEGATPADAAAVARAVVAGTTVPGLLLEVREVRGGARDAPAEVLGWVVAGVWTDAELLEQVPVPGGVALIDGTRVLAARGAPAAAVPAVAAPAPGGVATLRVGEQTVTATTAPLAPGAGADGPVLLIWQPADPGVALPVLALAVLAPSVLLAGLLGWILAGSVVAPVRRAAGVARAVAAGDLDHRVEPTGGREVAELAVALNTMSDELAARLAELERSRDEARQSLARLGRTLSSSLDLDRTLAVVVETAIQTLAADRGLLRLYTPERDALYVKVGRGVGRNVPRLAVGEGVAGAVARVGTPVRLPDPGAPTPAPGEPVGAAQLAVPMIGRGRVIGVLSLLRDDGDRPFTQDDLDTVRSFAAQASVAIENVLLHQEAQRLSVTDPLTGLWNFRYFQLQADRELESAARFERPLSLVIADLDHFKTVNDEFGHQVGDEVLITVARRIQAATRVPDVVARYGGEEFVVLLPGTDLEGAVATAERIRAAVSGAAVAVEVDAALPGLAVTCSLGVATHPQHGTTVARLLRSADGAMYAAKARGRNRVVEAQRRPDDDDVRRRPSLEADPA